MASVAGPDVTPASGQPAFVDLQVHTTASDGALSPTDVVEAAQRANLAAIAITDHDTIDGVAEALAVGARVGVRIVTGVELSTHFGGDELHLLGLHLSHTDTMRAELLRFRHDRIGRAERVVDLLVRLGVPVTMDAVMHEAGQGAVGRPHIARAMIAAGLVKDFREAFDRWLGLGRPAYVEKPRFDVAEGIALVHRAGGLAVWAHPGEWATSARVATLAAAGLDGVEVLHPGHPPIVVQKLLSIVEATGLLASGGSDWHGTHEGPRRLGGQMVPKVWLDKQDDVVNARRLMPAADRP